MKTRNLIIILAVTFSAIAFSSCTDESEGIMPQNSDDESMSYTGGQEGEEDVID